jgi:hypothetical protein
MDTKIYLTGLALIATWLVIEEARTRIYELYTRAKVLRLLDEMDDRPKVKPTPLRPRKTTKKK